MRIWFSKQLAFCLIIVAALAFGVALSPLEHPQNARAQGVGPAQIVQAQGSCSGIAGSMFAFYFSAQPVHYTATFDRNGNMGTCQLNNVGGNITVAGQFNGSGAGLFSIPPSAIVGGLVNTVTGTQNVACAGTNNVVCNVASPVATAAPSSYAGWSPTFGLVFFPPPATAAPNPATTASVYGWNGSWTALPSPSASCANANCSVTGTGIGALVITVVTPTPKPDPTSANANCSFAVQVLTCITPAPLSTVLHGAIVMTLPTTLASTGATTYPVPVSPFYKNLVATGAASSCGAAGSGSAETYVFLMTNTSDQSGAYASAVPTTFVLPNATAKAGMQTLPAATAFATSTSAANGTWIVAKILAQSTTARSGQCTYTLFFDWTP